MNAHAAHLSRLRQLYGRVDPEPPDAEALRRQLAECAEPVAAVVAEAARCPTPERLEALGIRLQGIARLAAGLRSALLLADRGGPRDGA